MSALATPNPSSQSGKGSSVNDSVALARDLLDEVSHDRGEDGAPGLAEALLRDAVRVNATDIHLEPRGDGAAVRFRIDGAVLDAAVLPTAVMERLENQLKVATGLNPMPASQPQSAHCTTVVNGEEIDIRLSALSAFGGERLTVRMLRSGRLKPHESNQMPDRQDIDRFLERLRQREGMLLVTGPTGSGKTTTVYGLIHELSKDACSVITVEDPPELKLDTVTQFAVDKEHGLSFAAGIRAGLRMDPDYMLIGELRDRESGRAALDAATTGCSILATLHARDAAGVLTSLRKWDADNYEISTLISAVVAQRLVRRLCSFCRSQAVLTDEERSWFELTQLESPQKIARATGCPMCHGTGYSGRTAVFEVWIPQESDRRLLMENADERELRRHLANRGHRFLLTDAMARVSAEETDISEVRAMGGVGASLDAMRAVS